MTNKKVDIPFGNAICYSGYRRGQSPRENIFPSYEEIFEDLKIVEKNWSLIRLYDISEHAEIVLKVVNQENLDLKIMIGNDLKAEVSNPNCPWGADYSDEELKSNAEYNSNGINKLINLANKYREIIFSASIGNEASVDWTDHLVPIESLIDYAKRLKSGIKQPITFCENYVPWSSKIKKLVPYMDFISIHTYPVWEYKRIDQALDFTIDNYNSVAKLYPDKKVIITEAGWCTKTSGRGMDIDNASEELQTEYIKQLLHWTKENNILTFLFEAFDESWKGSEDELEPEKHWGLYFEDRTPKQVIEKLFK